MSEAQLVFLFIVPMSSESWYVRVALSANHSLHTQPTGNHGKTECCPLKKHWLKRAFTKGMSKTKEREIIVYMYNVFLVSSRGTIQKHLAGERNRGSSTI